MKNIHVLPTDKPSSLYILGNNELKLRYTIDLPIDSDIAVNQHIYITSDEEIKEGDWCIGMDGIFQYKGKVNIPDFELPKKIILTTDQDLIKDGVQAIDDEFLEWFVKNPSCEEVDINRDWGYPKIIIQKEEPTEEAKQRAKNYMSLKGALEPKQEIELQDFENNSIIDILNIGNIQYLSNGDIIYNPNLFFIKRGNKWFMKTKEPKQETLEEAAEKYWAKQPYNEDAFIKGVKWQQERSYSEEEVIQKILDFRFISNTDTTRDGVKKWFEQFKKK